MDLIDRLQEISARLPQQLSHLTTEEATKNALMMPFLAALGYDVFNPVEVIPEYTADVGTKKGEKVDYAVMSEGHPLILLECKCATASLDAGHASQLYRYFSVTSARFGILTNGVEYRFFSDLEEPNKMDERPFFEFSMAEVTSAAAKEVKRFAKESFDLAAILATASDLKYSEGIRKLLNEEWVNPSEDFVRLFAGRVYAGRMTQAVREQFTEITKKAFHEFVTRKVNDRLQSALEGGTSHSSEAEELDEGEAEGQIVTTDEELEGYYICRSILSETVDPRRVFMRDRKSYCGVILDDNNRKPICRLHFNSSRNKYLGLFDASKTESRVPLSEVTDIYSHADVIRAVVRHYDGADPVDEGAPELSV